jgi:GMP synthase (glutamine-hydrolysing)
MTDKIAVLDFGGQYAHLIANRIRRLNVYSEIFEADTYASKLKECKGIILSGGPQSVYDSSSVKCDPAILNLGIPVLGICYGHQLMVYIQGGKVESGAIKEYGLAQMKILKKKGIFQGLRGKETVWMSHGDSVTVLPSGYETIGTTDDCENAAVANFAKNYYGIQFHPEVTHTPSGMKMLENFLNLCGAAREWKIENFIEQEMEAVRTKVGDRKVFMLVSGGVDSTVAFALLAQALGQQRVYGLFVDTGLLRLNERSEVEKNLREIGVSNLHVKDASALYFEKLKEVFDPEEKRKIIGDLFLQVQADTVKELGLNPDEWLLGQGTIYPDTIESGGTKHAAKIKTHHNRVPQIEEMIRQGRVIEPLAQLYKDEVREVGEKLGLPAKMVWRHPFPGPGLGVRCLCSKDVSWPDDREGLNGRLRDEAGKYGLDATLLPLHSVGVQGDFRTYRHPAAVIGRSDFVRLEEVSTALINQNREINRVLWLRYPEKIEMMEVGRRWLTPERIALLQQADDVVSRFIVEHGLDRAIWQFPTVLVPLCVNAGRALSTGGALSSEPAQSSGFEQGGSSKLTASSEQGTGSKLDMRESVVLRPVESEEAMTANFYKMDLGLLDRLVKRLAAIPGVCAVFYDVTNKPPGTIEWE